MLQVQPESGNGQITLKPMANSTVLIADESLADVLSNMGLKIMRAIAKLSRRCIKRIFP